MTHGLPHVQINFVKIAQLLASRKVPATVDATLTIAYPVDDDDPESKVV